jgi:hypothetical protein
MRVKANSYGDGRKYAGGNTFTNADGTVEKVYGYFTSPGGKVTYTYDDDSAIVLESKDIYEVGTVYKGEEVIYKPAEIMTRAEIEERAAKMGEPMEKYFVAAAKELGKGV